MSLPRPIRALLLVLLPAAIAWPVEDGPPALANHFSGHAGEAPTTPSVSRAVFERFKRMQGNWNGRSTKGWRERVTYRVVAGGSVVMSTSFGAHPSETMVTMYAVDGERLLLTHYCVAKNQPRLVATSFDDGGRTVTFTFLDGGNLPSRERGHMDKAIYRFEDENHVTARWTWYQEGRERWMEEIRLTRKR